MKQIYFIRNAENVRLTMDRPFIPSCIPAEILPSMYYVVSKQVLKREHKAHSTVFVYQHEIRALSLLCIVIEGVYNATAILMFRQESRAYYCIVIVVQSDYINVRSSTDEDSFLQIRVFF